MPVALYFGEEAFLRERAVQVLRQQVVDPAMAALSYKKLDQPSVGTLLEAVGATSLCFGSGSLLEIRQFEPLEKALDDEADKAQLDRLMQLLGSTSPTRHLLFVSPKIDRKVKFAKWLSAQADVDVQEFKPFGFWETDKAVAALIRLTREQGMAIDPPAAQLLVSSMGVSLQPLVNEVAKLALYAHGRAITVSDVQTLSGHNDNAFGMLRDWILDKPRAGVFATLDELLLRQHPAPLYGLLQSQLHHVYSLHYLRQRGLGVEAIAARLKKHPYKTQKDLEEYARASLPRLQALKERALDLEWRCKTGQIEGRLSLELLLGA